MAVTYTQYIYNQYKPIDASPSGLLEILIMFLSPFKRNISFSVQETDTISPDPSKPAIVACPKTNKTKKQSQNLATVQSTQAHVGAQVSHMIPAICYDNFRKRHRVLQSKVR